MSESDTPNPARQLVFAYQLDAPPEKVWRALSIPAFRERWLPAEVEAVSAVPGRSSTAGSGRRSRPSSKAS